MQNADEPPADPPDFDASDVFAVGAPATPGADPPPPGAAAPPDVPPLAPAAADADGTPLLVAEALPSDPESEHPATKAIPMAIRAVALRTRRIHDTPTRASPTRRRGYARFPHHNAPLTQP
ncbi:hypothetical protein GCM10023205_59330 [Yinghuangia aomiensis]|uniref:Uncharacterized protein n=1 Tax=Yinghuangia aomiensis TaxID=676205 RepID=A0ABP9HYX7_9ACTN